MKNPLPKLAGIALSVLILCVLAAHPLKAQLSGTAFRDFNNNGTRQTAAPMIEPLIAGVIVNVYNSSDALIASFTTNASGAYSIPASGTAYNGTPGSNTGFVASGASVRLEFILPTNMSCLNTDNDLVSPGVAIAGNSNVQFVTGGSTGINFPVNMSSQYVSNLNPYYYVIRSVQGNPTAGTAGTATTRPAIQGIPYNAANTSVGATTPVSRTMAASYIGSCYGLAYSKQAGKLFTSAFIKRHTGLGPLGSGGIYILDTALGTPASAASVQFYDMDNNGYYTRTNGGPAYGSGTSYTVGSATTITFLGTTDPVTSYPSGMGVVGSNTARGLTNDATARSNDPAAVAQTGMYGLGDLEISDDGKALYSVNLYDRKVYQLNLNSVTNPTGVSSVNALTIPNPPLRSSLGGGYAVTYASDNSQFYDGTKGFLRPFGLKFYRGKLYVGAATTGEKTGTTTTDNNTGNPEYTDLWAYVFEYDPATNTWASAPVLQFPLNFDRGLNTDNYNETFKVWKNTGFTTSLTWNGSNRYFLNQAIFCGIEFDPSDGSMVIGLRDRVGDQFGHFNYMLSGTTMAVATAMGETLRAYRTSSCTYELESNGKEGPSSSKTATSGAGNGQGPGGGEFYFHDNLYSVAASQNANYHLNTTAGAITSLPGTGEIAVTSMDPNGVWQQGVDFFSSTNGDNPRDHAIEVSNSNDNNTGYSGKGIGLGDIELIEYNAPISIGNRVWNDTNGNGIQDAGESGIANVLLELVDANGNAVDSDPSTAGVQATTVLTSATGSWYLTSMTGTDATGVNYGVALLPNTSYRVRLATSGTGYDWDASANNGEGGPLAAGNLAGLQLTRTNKIGNGAAGLSDNDAVMTSSIPQVVITTGDYGSTNYDIDFGFKPLASVGDRVWRDDDKDGVQDTGEPGVAGVAVALYTGTTLVATTVTDAYGNYLFDNLAAGSYSVVVTLPANYQFTTQTNTVDNTAGTAPVTTGSDVNATTGQSYTITLSAGENERNIDAGIIFNSPAATASVGNRVWFDTNNDNLQTAGEPGVAGVTVSLLDNLGNTVATTITDANGNYLFTNVTPGTYSVRFSAPPGTTFVTANQGANGTGTGTAGESDADSDAGINGITGTFTVTTGQQIVNVDAGIRSVSTALASLGDRVWYDNDRDGIQDAGEPGIPGVTVTLYRPGFGPDGIAGNGDDANAVATATTDGYGNYLFASLTPGTYRLNFGAVAGMVRTAQNIAFGTLPDGIDSDPDPSAGNTGSYTLSAGVKNMSADAGYYSSQPAANAGALGDKVWSDLNANGVQDAGEPGVSGITVTLYNNAGTAISVTYTDANGNYLFTNLTPGSYTAGFSNLPSGYSFTAQDLGGNDATDSDVIPGTGRTASATVTAGATNTTVDAGIRQGMPSGLASIGNFVWYDLNSNGLQETGELGVAGVTVTLLNAGADGIVGNGDDGATLTTTTNALGQYSFTALAAGNYAVQFSNLPSGFALSASNSGSNDNLDSDGGALGTGGAPAGASRTGVYALAVGEDNLSIDLGITPPANTNTVGNFVWQDLNGDGLQTVGEPGVPGVTVTLYNNSGTAIATTTTDANGNYIFAGLADGTYSTGFTNLPAGYEFAAKDASGSTTLTGSDADRTSGRTGTVALASGNRNDVTLDAGLISSRAALGNFVWNDYNNDGIQTAGEPGVGGATVSLYYDADNNGSITGAEATNPVATAITDANGAYYFPNLLPGNYMVGFTTVPVNMLFTQQNTPGDNQDNTNNDANPSTGLSSLIALTANETDLTIDAGITVSRPATIGNFVWADLNKDGIQDANEPGISGVLVTLYNASNTAIGSAITDGNGRWQITNVPAGTGYYLIFSANLPNFDVTGTPGTNPAYAPQNTGANATQSLDSGTESDTDSDVTASGGNAGRTGAFSIVAGNNFPNMDAGIINWPFSNILPVRLESFTAAPQGSHVILDWKAGIETNLSAYVVEYGTDGINFHAIGTVTASGRRSYGFLHTSPVTGLNYYRLKMLDKDGQFRYSEIRRVNFNSSITDVQVYPLPADRYINVTVTAAMTGKPAVFCIISSDGKTVQQQQFTALSQTENLDMSRLPNGRYFLRISSNGQLVTKAIIVQR